jgi:paraquat-inducible protein B
MKKANPAAVGAFVIGALVMLVAGVVIIGGASLFADKVRYVLYFDSSVNGLTVGSPVKMQGVEIGSVVEVNALADTSKMTVVNEIVIRVDRSRFKRTGADDSLTRRTQYLIEHGMRARLELQSIVTGQLYVGLDFQPDTEIRLLGIPSEYEELPTIPSLTSELENTMRAFFARLKDVPIENIMKNLDSSLAGLSEILNSPDLKAAVAQLDETVGEARGALGQAKGAFTNIDSAVEPDSDVRYQLSVALEEVAGAARAIRLLADYIERNPNSVVFGRDRGGN